MGRLARDSSPGPNRRVGTDERSHAQPKTERTHSSHRSVSAAPPRQCHQAFIVRGTVKRESWGKRERIEDTKGSWQVAGGIAWVWYVRSKVKSAWTAHIFWSAIGAHQREWGTDECTPLGRPLLAGWSTAFKRTRWTCQQRPDGQSIAGIAVRPAAHYSFVFSLDAYTPIRSTPNKPRCGGTARAQADERNLFHLQSTPALQQMHCEGRSLKIPLSRHLRRLDH